MARLMICQWFLLCDHPAVGIVPHPILNWVPACQRCVDKLDLPGLIVGTFAPEADGLIVFTEGVAV